MWWDNVSSLICPLLQPPLVFPLIPHTHTHTHSSRRPYGNLLSLSGQIRPHVSTFPSPALALPCPAPLTAPSSRSSTSHPDSLFEIELSNFDLAAGPITKGVREICKRRQGKDPGPGSRYGRDRVEGRREAGCDTVIFLV